MDAEAMATKIIDDWGHESPNENDIQGDWKRLEKLIAQALLSARNEALREAADILLTKAATYTNKAPHHILMDNSEPDVLRKLYASTILGRVGK